jgi:peptidyl-tRNA hydrolase
MKMPTDSKLSEKSKNVRKEIDDWLKEGNKKTIIPTKENK